MGTNDPPKVGSLGDLETEVLKALWRIEQGTVPEVLQALSWDRSLAYTTVMTVLNRLVEKSAVERLKEGRFFVYFPLVSREAVAGTALRRVIDRFFDGLGHRAMAQLLSEDEELDDEGLERLERLIEQRRKESSDRG